MHFKNKAPDLVVLSQNKNDTLSMVVNPQEIDVEYIFGSFSKMTFKVRKFIYNESTQKWVINPCYEHLEKNNILYTSEQTDIFKFKGHNILPDSFYYIPYSQPNTRNTTSSDLCFNVTGTNFKLRDETLLYNIGCYNGYSFEYCSYFNSDGVFVDGMNDKDSQTGDRIYYQNEAVQEFFPVKVGDIIAMGCKNEHDKMFDKDAENQYAYRLIFYSEADSTTKTRRTDWLLYNPVGRYRVKNGDFGTSQYEDMNHISHNHYTTEGYFRIECRSYKNTQSFWTAPASNYVYVISGERYCTEVTLDSEQNVSFGLPYWVIKDTEELGEGYNSTKTIIAYSYESVISGKNISILEDTYPLYIPEKIIKTITEGVFYIDSADNVNYQGNQRTRRGIINIILDELPDWSIGYVSDNLITKYRTINECDNTNIYSFLMNTIQELYKCHIIFNTNDNTINLISQDDIVSVDSGVMIGWRNALKSLTVTNVDEEYVTSMYINAGDNQYGLGLVNPNGSNIIYNFDNVADKMDYIVDDKHYVNLHEYDDDEEDIARPQTLKTLWKIYKIVQSRILNGTTIYNSIKFKDVINNMIDYQMELVKLETKLSEAYTNYMNVADSINLGLDWDDSNYPRIPEKPLTTNELTNGDFAPIVPSYANFSSESLYRKLYNAAYIYENVRNNYFALRYNSTILIYKIKDYNSILSLNPKVLQTQYDYVSSNFINNIVDEHYRPVFTPKEAKELSKFIVQGVWTNDNIVFDNNYSRDDIINILQPVYNEAVTDLANIYSKPTYEFSADIASLAFNQELSNMVSNLYLGNSLYIVSDNSKKLFKTIQPILLSFHIKYGDYDNSSITLSTDYKQKPWEIKFTKLFGMVSQTSVDSPNYIAEN